MALRNRISARRVIIQRMGATGLLRYDKNVTIGVEYSPKDNTAFIKVLDDKEVKLSEPLDQYRWLQESSTTGVAAMMMSSVKIVVIYDAQDKLATDFFAEMKNYLKEKQIELATTNLIESIRNGSQTEAKRCTIILAEERANLKFNLSNTNDDDSKTASGSSIKNIQLTLQIECHLNREPLVGKISVPVGTRLCDLKYEVEKHTGINRQSQVWYAFNKYIINDQYVLGSTDPVVRIRPGLDQKEKAALITDPIRSGDTLIMYIACIEPYL